MNEEPPSPYREEIADLLLRVYEIHEDLLAATGGLPGLRDATTLHAAVARPFATYQGQELYPTDWEKAAALFHSLIKSHPFLDGSKRTAFAAALYFLERSGHALPLTLPQDEVIRFCLEVAEEGARSAAGQTVVPKTVAEIAAWFQRLLG
ncbi:MAG: type II toxin-antitoxin system death-on-curing family toxin [Chloroflexi bacterium]|nr:type II toxin-antitoxin system death-on-curing family toxin [Chloroflexota bacterium]